MFRKTLPPWSTLLPVRPSDLRPRHLSLRQRAYKAHSDAADIEAAMRADERLAAGDMEGEAVWLRIVKAIAELLSEERPNDAEVH